MAAHYVRKQTDHQGKRLGEDAKKLYHGHQRHGDFQPSGDLRPEDVFPIGLVSEDVDDEQHTEGEENVIVILPVTLAPPGKTGINPIRLVMKMKKKAVSKKAHRVCNAFRRCWA